MTPNPIFNDGRLRPGIYKIQNIYTETFLDIKVHSRELCCRPAGRLGEGRGIVRPISFIWDSRIRRLEVGCQTAWGRIHDTEGKPNPFKTISTTVCNQGLVQFDPGEPEQFCTPLDGI